MLQILFFVFREINILSRKTSRETSSDPPKTISAFGGSDDAPGIGAEMSKYAAKVKKQNITGESGRIKKKKTLLGSNFSPDF